MGQRQRSDHGLSAEDRALLDRLVVDLGPRLTAYARYVAGSGEAEDVVAEAFCRAAANMRTLRSSLRPDLYLLTVVRNLCRDRQRRRQTRPPAQAIVNNEVGADCDPPTIAAGRERLEALRQAVAELPESLREVVVLRLSSGLTFEETAAVLQVPLGTALSRMHAAIQRIRERLEPDYGS